MALWGRSVSGNNYTAKVWPATFFDKWIYALWSVKLFHLKGFKVTAMQT